MLVVVDLTGVLETLILSVGSTRSCHLQSYAPTSPSNLFQPDGAMMIHPRLSWYFSNRPPIRVVTRGVSSSIAAHADVGAPRTLPAMAPPKSDAVLAKDSLRETAPSLGTENDVTVEGARARRRTERRIILFRFEFQRKEVLCVMLCLST